MVTKMGRSSKKSSGEQVGASPLEGVVSGWSGAGEANKVWAVACVHTGAMAGMWMLHGCEQAAWMSVWGLGGVVGD